MIVREEKDPYYQRDYQMHQKPREVECEIGKDITCLGNRSNEGRLGCLSEAKILIFTCVRVTP